MCNVYRSKGPESIDKKRLKDTPALKRLLVARHHQVHVWRIVRNQRDRNDFRASSPKKKSPKRMEREMNETVRLRKGSKTFKKN